MTGKKIGTQERDRTVRRYKELFIRRGAEIAAEFEDGFAGAADDYFACDPCALVNEPETPCQAAIDRALGAIKRALDYNGECNAIERTFEELAADGDVRSINILNDEGTKKFRERRAAWIQSVREYQQKIVQQKIVGVQN